ncbi:O-antigen polymerase [Bifidobacterium felsineum]|uniref:O-antigen polymerase n=1 Tax=Bifidobacterium felsineum TaxID=2045440 RepID=UPI001BDCF49C|nr:O-antigen polymerase [Bifidobacterium felsineum]MBT1165056.1 oligosaccharide repeat unit polymerase [Bifidobacterium felsineum]
MKEVDSSTYKIITIGVVSFVIGYFIVLVFSKLAKNNNNKCNRYVYNTKVITIFAFCCIIFYLPLFAQSFVELIRGGSFESIRYTNRFESTANTGIYNLISYFIIQPFSSCLELIAPIDFWFGKRDRKLFFTTMILIFIRMISDAGRTPFVNFMIYMVLCYCIVKGNKQKTKQEKRYNRIILSLFLVFALFVILYISISRSSSGLSRQLYFYFAMAPVLLNYWISLPESLSFGLASFNGFIFTVLYFLTNITGTTYPNHFQNVYDLIAATDSTWIPIASGGVTANAYVSLFWFFYNDGGFAGIIIYSLIYGMLVTTVLFKINNLSNIRFIALYLLLMQGLIFSFIRFPFAKAQYCITFIIILILIHKESDVKI